MKNNLSLRLNLLVVICFVSTSLFAQIRLNVQGNAKFRGRIDAATTDDSSLFIGLDAGLNDDGDNVNTFIGLLAGKANTSGSFSTAVGAFALLANTDGFNNTAFGAYTLLSNSTGANNTAIGYNALGLNNGGCNTAIGAQALLNNQSGGLNTATGYFSMRLNATGYYNVAMGGIALYNNTNGYYNTATGYEALVSNTDGASNVAAGISALNGNTVGNYNTAIGPLSMQTNTVGHYNTCIGESANTSVNNLQGGSSLGASAVVNANNKVVLGANIGDIVIGGYANWSNLSDGRFKEEVKEGVPGLAFIRSLRPVTYVVNIDKLQRHITAAMPDTIAARYLPTEPEIRAAKATIQTGFIAQEVEAVAKRIGYQFDGVNAPKNETDNYSIAYGQFVPSLVKAIQEQQEAIEQQDEKIQELRHTNEALEARLAKLEALLSTETDVQLQGNDQARLEQNTPNPFSGETQIRYYLPSGIKTAQLRISANGQIIKTITLKGSGEGTVNIHTIDFPSGTYQYSLLIDGNVAATKQMVLTKN